MEGIRKVFIKIGMVAIVTIVFPSALALAQEVGGRANDKEVNSLLERIEKNTQTFRKSVDRALDKSPLDSTKREDNVNDFMKEFETATKMLEERFDQKRVVSGDVTNVLNRAVTIDSFVSRHTLTEQVKSDWNVVRADLDTLAKYFNVTWSWTHETN